MKKRALSNKEVRELNNAIIKYNFQFGKKDRVEIEEDEKYRLARQNSGCVFFYLGEEIIPCLKPILNGKIILKKIVVDMGAVKFVANGADIMRPGIVSIDEGIIKNEFVEIVDMNNKKPLAIGRALFSSEEMKNMVSGKVIENIHFIGDEIWNS
jgi:PUA domain protein